VTKWLQIDQDNLPVCLPQIKLKFVAYSQEAEVQRELEIWGKAQRESAWRRKFDWGENSWELIVKSHCPKSNATQNAHCRFRVG